MEKLLTIFLIAGLQFTSITQSAVLSANIPNVSIKKFSLKKYINKIKNMLVTDQEVRKGKDFVRCL